MRNLEKNPPQTGTPVLTSKSKLLDESDSVLSAFE